MLKRVVSVILILPIVLALSYAPPAYAELAQVVVAQVQAGGDGAATQEFITLFNNGPLEVDISGWCVMNKSGVKFACIVPPAGQAAFIPSHSHAIIASQSFVDSNDIGVVASYAPTHATNGSLTGSADTVKLLDRDNNIVDTVSWTTAIPAGYMKQRTVQSQNPFTYNVTGSVSDWSVESVHWFWDTVIEYRESAPISCEGLNYMNQQGQCVRYYLPLTITEILPNATGSDEGKEFIEVFNPNDQSLNLSDYVLSVGVQLDKSYSLPPIIVEPFGYTTISNQDVSFTLVNTLGMVQIASIDGSIIELPPAYNSPKEGESWAIIDSVWQYTNQPTPAASNKPSVALLEDEVTVEVGSKESTLKPCVANQERNPETNRCRLIATQTASSTLTPCKEGQERNPETNRCRSIASTQDGPAPCKEGQERNPETNRCRNIVNMPDAGYEVLGVSKTSNDDNWWYVAAAIIGLVLLAGGYAIWEWRREIAKLYLRFAGFVRSRK